MLGLQDIVERAEQMTKKALEQAREELGQDADIMIILARAKQIRNELKLKEEQQ